MPDQHVVPHTEGWAVRGANSKRASSVHKTQKLAITRANTLARKQGTKVVIHRPTGKIRSR